MKFEHRGNNIDDIPNGSIGLVEKPYGGTIWYDVYFKSETGRATYLGQHALNSDKNVKLVYWFAGAYSVDRWLEVIWERYRDMDPILDEWVLSHMLAGQYNE